MRSEQEMYDLILEVARRDERIRAVYQNGSRVNPNAPRDIFQDYDIVYVVKETASFRRQERWLDVFGKRLYMQKPEEMDAMLGKEADLEHCYGYLMQFSDGNRLDLHLQTLCYSRREIVKDKLCRTLLDKDGALPAIPDVTDRDYWVKKPGQAQFSCCCNEFWWLMNNVAKGLWRKEIPYVIDMLERYVRPQLVAMLSWYIGIQTGFSCSVGKSGKYLQRLLPPECWERFVQTYSAAVIPQIWRAVFAMCDLFEETALLVANALSLCYNQEEGSNSRFFLENAYCLPQNAEDVIQTPFPSKGDKNRI